MIATKTPTMVSRFFLGFRVWVQLRRNSKNVGAICFTSASSFSHVNSLRMYVLLSRRTELVLSEQRPAISRRSDAPKPLTKQNGAL